MSMSEDVANHYLQFAKDSNCRNPTMTSTVCFVLKSWVDVTQIRRILTEDNTTSDDGV